MEREHRLLKKYYSGYLSTDWFQMPSNFTLRGRYFSLYFGVPQNKDSFVSKRIISPNGREIEIEGKEIIIEASNFENAVKASELIHASSVLISGGLLSWNAPKVHPFSKEESEIQDIGENESLLEMHLPDSLSACQIACKASFRRAYTYGLLKYRLGTFLFSVSQIDLDPFLSAYFPLSPFPPDLVRMTYAIIAFYSVIEEIGLEIRASEKNPSFINGNWNPQVKRDLETRLLKSGIKPKELFSWNLRSTPTRIEKFLRKDKRLKKVQKSQWSRGKVRDTEIFIEDAILITSWLRSKVSSHKFNRLAQSLSIYDVSNANYLARRLLLGKLGFWEKLRNKGF